jgi:TonB family protein
MSSCRIWLVLGVLVAASTAFAQEGSELTHLMDDSGDRKPLQTMVPVYPQRALEDRIQGEVEVCFNIDREGRTSRIAVRHSSNRIFEKPALLAVRASSYTPLPAGKPLSGIKTCRTFRFLLDPVAITDPSEVLAVEP